MRIPIPGGAGFIGSNQVNRLFLDGNKVMVLDRFPPRFQPLEFHRDWAAPESAMLG